VTTSPTAIALFIVVIAITLVITTWAARRSRSRSDFYVAGGSITGTQNGLAIAGDFMSASTILGVAGFVFAGNAESIIYLVGPIVGFAFVFLFIAEPLRNLGRYTVAEVIGLRFPGRAMRVFAAVSSLVVTLFYLVAQMVGAGALIEVLINVPYKFAVMGVAVLMMLYVFFGGMLATTWVQITKAVLLIIGVLAMSWLAYQRVNFDMSALYRLAADNFLAHAATGGGGAIGNPISSVSLALTLSLGIAGLPHILLRFFTVPDARQARKSIFVAMAIIIVVFILVQYVLSYAAVAFLYGDPQFFANGKLIGGSNVPIIHLAHVLGGDVLLGIVSAVAFATILAVVSGLTLAGASAIAHDLYAHAIKRGSASEASELIMFRIATVGVTIAAAALGIVFQGKNIAYMVGLAFTVAASANFPVLLLTLYWRKLTRRAALIGGTVGLLVSVALIVGGPPIWVGMLGHGKAFVPYAYPALFSMPLAFLVCWFVSILDARSNDAQAQATFDELQYRGLVGAVPPTQNGAE
jgi:cation/acetate symporter